MRKQREALVESEEENEEEPSDESLSTSVSDSPSVEEVSLVRDAKTAQEMDIEEAITIAVPSVRPTTFTLPTLPIGTPPVGTSALVITASVPVTTSTLSVADTTGVATTAARSATSWGTIIQSATITPSVVVTVSASAPTVSSILSGELSSAAVELPTSSARLPALSAGPPGVAQIDNWLRTVDFTVEVPELPSPSPSETLAEGQEEGFTPSGGECGPAVEFHRHDDRRRGYTT